jgi:class 3 adenylate cyclase
VDASESLERRIVTVLFADLVGFTTLSEQFDAEDVAAIQDRYFAAVRETIGRYGGNLEKFIGDAAMAVFGVPRSRDDDAERAVRAGLALTHAVQQIGADLGLDDDALRLRVGVNTGEVVIAASGPDAGRVTGDTINTAARLQTAAPPGRVLVGETTALAVADSTELEPASQLELKGKAEATTARLVAGLRPEPSRDEAMGALRAPTLGREAELAELEAAYTRLAGSAAGAAERWLIVAPPGVGKSRLLRELAMRLASAPEAPLVLRTRSRADTVAPFEAVAILMCGALDTTDNAVARRALIDTLDEAGVPELRAGVVVDACVAVAWPDVTTASERPLEERDVLFAAWLDGIDAIAASRPQVWLVEDVHWAGGDVLAFLDLATTRAAVHGRLVVATTRPSLLEANAAWAADQPDAGRHLLQLPTLAPTDARSLVTALVGDALPEALVERIAERSDGNCLFIEELLRTWVSVGTLVRDERVAGSDGAGNGWRLTVAADEIPLPASVQSIYAAQLDDLPPDARRLARRASVAGRRFPVGALEPLAAADSGLESLRRRELVVGPLTEPLFGTAFSYRHALLRDAGYASLARAERARLHVRLARWLEQAAGEHAAEVAEQIAGHYSAALDSAPALAKEIDAGLDRESVRRLAAEWYERAGQGTLALSAHDAARQLLRRSIDLTPQEARLDGARRWERLGDATAFAADMDEGAAAYQKAMELYRAALGAVGQGFDTGADALAGAGQMMLHKLAPLARMSPEAAAELERGAKELSAGADELRQSKVDLAEALGQARTGLARTAASLSDVMYQQLRFAESRDLAQQVMNEVGDGDPASAVRLLIARARGGLGAGGPSPEIERDFERAAVLAGQTADPHIELEAQGGLTLLHSESGRGSADDWRRVEEMALRVGNWKEAIGAATNAIMFTLDDRAAGTFEPIESARQTAVAHGLTEETGWLDYLEAEGAFVSGDWTRARQVGLRAVDLGEANAYLRMTVRTWHLLIPIAGVTGDRDILARAARWYKSLEGKFEFPDSPYSRVIRAAQDLELARAGLWPAYVPEVEPRIASFDDDPSGPSWSAALDRILRAWIEAGELDGAGRALAATAGVLARMPKVTHLGLGTYELMRGRLAAARVESDDAATAGRAALDHFRTSAAPWWMAKAIRLIERAGGADDGLLAEVSEIERALGATTPTA